MLNLALENCDLIAVYKGLATGGLLLIVYVMQKSWHDDVAMADPEFLRWLRRIGQGLVALAFGWSVLYLDQKAWQPWPPFIGIVAAIDFVYAVRAATLFWRSLPMHRIRLLRHEMLQEKSPVRRG